MCHIFRNRWYWENIITIFFQSPLVKWKIFQFFPSTYLFKFWSWHSNTTSSSSSATELKEEGYSAISVRCGIWICGRSCSSVSIWNGNGTTYGVFFTWETATCSETTVLAMVTVFRPWPLSWRSQHHFLLVLFQMGIQAHEVAVAL